MGRGKRQMVSRGPMGPESASGPLTVTVADIPRESKEDAAVVRREQILPALAAGQEVVLDFKDLDMVTQGFVHSLISEAIQLHGEDILDWITFKNCEPMVRQIVELVIDYSLGYREQAPEANPSS